MPRYKIALLLSFMSIASISAAIITPALPMIEKDFLLPQGAIEWVISVFLLGYVIGPLLYGPMGNRFGALKSLRCGLVINLLGIALCLLAWWSHHYGLLLLGRFISALGSSAGLSCTITLINSYFSSKKAQAVMSWSIVSFTLGLGLAVSVGGLVSDAFQWVGCFVLLLIQGVLMLGLSFLFKEPDFSAKALNISETLKGFKMALKSHTLVIYALTLGFVSAVSYCYSAEAPFYAERVLLLSASAYGAWNALNMIGMLLSGVIAAVVMPKKGPKCLIQVGLIGSLLCLMSLSLMVLVSVESCLWFFTTTMFMYLFAGIMFPAASFLASNAIADKSNASSMMSFINMGTAFIAVTIMGYLPVKIIASMIIVLAGYYLLVIILLKRLQSKTRQLGVKSLCTS